MKKIGLFVIVGVLLIIGVVCFTIFKRSEEECVPFSGGQYTLYVDKNNNEKLETISVCIACSPDNYEKVEIPEFEGYEFGGWYYDKDFTKEAIFKTTMDITPIVKLNKRGCMIGYEDITIYAKWTKK